jgi:PhnB protein
MKLHTYLNPVPPEKRESILHARIIIGETAIMASDVEKEHFQPMRSAYLSLNLDSGGEAERIHTLLADGSQIFMAMEETSFAHRFCMLRDTFGASRMIIHEGPMPGSN